MKNLDSALFCILEQPRIYILSVKGIGLGFGLGLATVPPLDIALFPRVECLPLGLGLALGLGIALFARVECLSYDARRACQGISPSN